MYGTGVSTLPSPPPAQLQLMAFLKIPTPSPAKHGLGRRSFFSISSPTDQPISARTRSTSPGGFNRLFPSVFDVTDLKLLAYTHRQR
jgi:hypothetical protein